LSDGTVVKINRTVIADTSNDGHSFFFHSTSYNNHDNGKTSYDEEEEDIDPEFGNRRPEVSEVPAIETDEEVSSSSTAAPTIATTISGFVPQINDDESFNEVLGDVDTKKNQSDKGIDDGLVTIEAVQ
jgi:hypothetical protein